jgi:DNA polymerase III subunit beta
MRLDADRDVLAEAVAWTARALPARPYAPLLAGMRLHAGQDLTLSGYDYQVSAQATVPVTIREPGTILVSGRVLAEIVRGLPSRPVTLSGDGTRATINCGAATFTLMQMPDGEYPSLPAMPPPAGSVDSVLLAAAVAQVAIAVSRDDTLPALTGIRVEAHGDRLTFAATDRYRLAVRALRWNPAQPGIDAAILIPGRGLADAARALTAAGEVSIAFRQDDSSQDGIAGLQGAGRVTTMRVLGAEYPKYHETLPGEPALTAELAAGPLGEAVRRVALVAARNTPVRLAFTAGRLTVEAGTSDEARAAETLEASCAGPDMTIAFNPAYLCDGLTALGSATARIALTSPTVPAVITPGTGRDRDYKYVLMPIRHAG